jgi:hypothetical protein
MTAEKAPMEPFATPLNAARATDDDAAACAIHFFLMTTQSFTDETL